MVWVLIPLMIAGGFDGVEPLRPSAPPRVILATAQDDKLREAGVREIARLTGYSNCYVCITRQGQRKARPLRAKMRELGLKFKARELGA